MMSKNRAFAICGVLFGVVGIASFVRHDILPGVLLFAAAVGFALRARKLWESENA
jgi:hypothetical protein